jgi:DNA-directed RNA polymerase subunit alpha
LEVEIYAIRGRGFRTFAQNREMVNSINIIATDSNFSPIVRVGYTVEEQKVSKTVTGDILTLEVATNGAISPQDSVAMAAKILSEHLKPLIDVNAAIETMQIIKEHEEEKKQEGLSIPIEELTLSVRSYNCLKRHGIQTINQLTTMTKGEVEKIKNLGKKSLREIQKQLVEYGLTFKEE